MNFLIHLPDMQDILFLSGSTDSAFWIPTEIKSSTSMSTMDELQFVLLIGFAVNLLHVPSHNPSIEG